MDKLFNSYTAFNNGSFCNAAETFIPVNTIGVNRGYGVFDFFGVIQKKPFYLDRHLDRFFNSIRILRLQIDYKREEVEKLIETIILKNEAADYYIKLFAIPLDAESARSLRSGFLIIPVDGDPFDKEVYTQGAGLITKEYLRFLPEVKSTNYLPVVYWYPEVVQNNAVDVLYFQNNVIHETSRGNIFIIKNNTFYTPAAGILKGITRGVVLDILKGQNQSTVEKDIISEELLKADEVFVTSTTKKILPIVKIDNCIIGTGRVGEKTKDLLHSFQKFQENWGR